MLRLATTHIRTGELLCDDLPLRVSSLSDALMADGSLTGQMTISDVVSDYRDAIAAGRVLLWAIWETTPIWVGVLWDHDRGSLLDDEFEITAHTLGSLFNRRVISDALSWTNAHPYDVFKDVVNNTLAKTGGNIGNFSLDKFITDTTTYTPMTRAYEVSDYTNLWDAMLAIAGDAGFEFHIRPNSNLLSLNFSVALEAIKNTTLIPTLTFPGNVVDSNYSYETSSAATHVRVTGVSATQQPLVSASPHGVAEELIANGWPLLESVINSGTSSGSTQGEIDTRADSELSALQGTRMLTEVTVTCGTGGILPTEVAIGDRVNLSLRDPLYGDINESVRVYSIEYITSNNYISAMKLGVG